MLHRCRTIECGDAQSRWTKRVIAGPSQSLPASNVLTPKTVMLGSMRHSLAIGQMPKLPWDATIKAMELFLKSPTHCPTNHSKIRSFQIRV
jgi:hypothetical protein